MFKLILSIAVFTIAFSDLVVCSSSSDSSSSGGSGSASLESYEWDCEKGDCGMQQTQIKFSIDVPKGGCEDNCLGAENSKKISDAILALLAAEMYSHEVIMDLKLIPFMYGEITYDTFSEHIKDNDFNYQGYQQLKSLVNTYIVCENVCKVFDQLRLALQQNAAHAEIFESPNDDGVTKTIIITGELVILSDIQAQVEEMLTNDMTIIRVVFQADTIILDSSLSQEHWHAMGVIIEGASIFVVRSIIFDVTGSTFDDGAYTEPDGYVEIYASSYEQGNNMFMIIPEPADEGGEPEPGTSARR